MTRETVIRVNALKKQFAGNWQSFTSFAQSMLGLNKGDGHQALDGVSFSATRGESIGFVGRNGAGKSTLLQILCGTMSPTEGELEVDGRIGALLELGAGFNPDFTGRENAKLGALVHGVSEDHLDDVLQEIEAFADLGHYFDRKVSQYSSGMQARLGFAIATHIEADILVIDEVLGVGDFAFQARCKRHMNDMVAAGKTLLFVSHDPVAVSSFCKRAIWIDGGKVVQDGPAREVVSAYVASMFAHGGGDAAAAPQDVPDKRYDPYWTQDVPVHVSYFRPQAARHGFGGAHITDVFFTDADGKRATTLICGEQATLHVVAKTERSIYSPIAGYILWNDRGQNIMGDNTFLNYLDKPVTCDEGQSFESRLTFRLPFLPTGRYSLAPSIIEGTQASHIHLDWVEDAVFLDVGPSPVRGGKVGLELMTCKVS